MFGRIAVPFLAAAWCVAALSGCQTSRRQEPYRATPGEILDTWRQVQPGMTTMEVVELLGRPTSMGVGATVQDWEYYGYPGQRASGYVRFRQQRVQRVDPPSFHHNAAPGGANSGRETQRPDSPAPQGVPTRPGRPAMP